MIDDEGSPFDAIVVPISIQGGAGGMGICIQVKSEERLAATPILALLTSKEKAIVHSFYGAGADVVLLSPFDPDLLYLQLSALGRQKRGYDEQLRHINEYTGFRQSTINAFNTVHDGLLIVNPDYKAIFLNLAVRKILAVPDEVTEQQLADTITQYVPLLKDHENRLRLAKTHAQPSEDFSSFDQKFVRMDGHSFRGVARVMALRGASNEIIGYAMSLTDMSSLQHLTNKLSQIERTRAFALLLSATCMRLSGSPHFGVPGSPTKYLQEGIARENLGADVGTVVTSLLEVVDLVINSETVVRVALNSNWHVAVRPSILIQILGHLIFYAVENSGIGGEVMVEAEENSAKQEVALIVTAVSRGLSTLLSDDYLGTLVRGDFSKISSDAPAASKINFGIGEAQRLAHEIGRTIEMKRSAEALKVRIKLPILV